MPHFDLDEITLMCLYNPGSRKELIDSLNEMLPYLSEDEWPLRNLANAVLRKLEAMTDAQFDDMSAEWDA